MPATAASRSTRNRAAAAKSLEPDDEHELQATARDRRQESGRAAGGEGAHLEESQVEHRRLHAVLDDEEGDQEDGADQKGGEHARRRPSHGVVQVGLDAVDDADENRRESHREGEVAPPVDGGRRAFAVVAQAVIAQTVPMMPKGTETQNTSRQSTTDSSPPAIRPMNEPPMAAT